VTKEGVGFILNGGRPKGAELSAWLDARLLHVDEGRPWIATAPTP
jgi:hypothetical protein